MRHGTGYVRALLGAGTLGLALAAAFWLSVGTAPARASSQTITGANAFDTLDGSAQDDDGIHNGTFTVNGALTLAAGASITCNDAGATNPDSACPIKIAVSGNLLMQSGSLIQAENKVTGGAGGNITITAGGDLTMLGATISSDKGGSTDDANAGDIKISVGNFPSTPPQGNFSMDSASAIHANSIQSGGDITISSGRSMQIDGTIRSKGNRTGTGAVQGRGGGMIRLDTGCVLNESNTGLISSEGKDPGADLVHLSGCDVNILGIVQSTTPSDGHALPNHPPNHCNADPAGHPVQPGDNAQGYTACVEIWANNIRIDSTTVNSGQTGADGVRAPLAAWIDLYAANNISLVGSTNTGDPFTVHANACVVGPCSNAFGGLVTVKALNQIVMTGRAVQANASAIGGNGGIESIEATNDVALDAASIQAIGPSGSNTHGGHIAVRSYAGDITGNVPGQLNATGDGGDGTVRLTACASPVSYSGATTPLAGTTRTPGVCGGTPAIPAYVVFHPEIWALCSVAESAGFVTLVKDNDANHDGAFSDNETVPKNGVYPWVVTYRLTITNETGAPTTLNTIGDDKTNDLTSSSFSPSCGSISLPQTLAAAATIVCYYDVAFGSPGSSPLVNTATITWNTSGSSQDPSTVNFAAMTLDKSSTTTQITAVGEVVPYSFLVINTGSVTLTGITLTDTKTDVPPSCPMTMLLAGAWMTCTGQHTVTQAEISAGGNLVNVAAASSNEAPDATDTVSIPIVQSPAMTLDKSSTTTQITAAGQVVPYSFLITNTGNITLTGVKLVDTKTDAAPSCPKTVLVPSESMTCTGSHTVTQAEINAGGNLVNVATASSNQAPDATDTVSIPIVQSPAMTLDKSSTTTQITAAGQVVPYSFLITNTGNITLTGVKLVDTKTDAAPSCPKTVLVPSESMTCTGSHTVTQAEINAGGNLVNVATASSNQAPDATDTVSIPIVQSPAMTLDKSSTTTQITAAGQVVPYSFLVKNTGNVTLTGVTLTDTKTDSAPSCPKTVLVPSESMTCTGSHTVTAAEFAPGGTLTNVANVTTDQGPTATDTVTIPMTVTCPSSPPKLNVRWHYSAHGTSGSWSGTGGATCGTPITLGPQSMEGDLKVASGETITAGYDFTLPGNIKAWTVWFSNVKVVFAVRCVSGATPSASTFTVNMPNQSYAVTNSNWYPSGDQHSSLVYQGSLTVPNLCNGGNLRLDKGGTFSALPMIN